MPIRRATPADASLIAQLIIELADYEKLRHEAHPKVDTLREQLADAAVPPCEAFIAETDAGDVAGFALIYYKYSTFLTNWGVHLEDLFVRPAFRKQGFGAALLQRVAQRAREQGAERLEWQVLDWNELAIDFYHQLGAKAMKEWISMRLTGDALAQFAAGKPD